MSQENVELARRIVEWFNARDLDALQAHSTDDLEIVPLRAAIEHTVYRGPGAGAAFEADLMPAGQRSTRPRHKKGPR
jgi:hypothetical protein